MKRNQLIATTALVLTVAQGVPKLPSILQIYNLNNAIQNRRNNTIYVPNGDNLVNAYKNELENLPFEFSGIYYDQNGRVVVNPLFRDYLTEGSSANFADSVEYHLELIAGIINKEIDPNDFYYDPPHYNGDLKDIIDYMGPYIFTNSPIEGTLVLESLKQIFIKSNKYKKLGDEIDKMSQNFIDYRAFYIPLYYTPELKAKMLNFGDYNSNEDLLSALVNIQDYNLLISNYFWLYRQIQNSSLSSQKRTELIDTINDFIKKREQKDNKDVLSSQVYQQSYLPNQSNIMTPANEMTSNVLQQLPDINSDALKNAKIFGLSLLTISQATEDFKIHISSSDEGGQFLGNDLLMLINSNQNSDKSINISSEILAHEFAHFIFQKLRYHIVKYDDKGRPVTFEQAFFEQMVNYAYMDPNDIPDQYKDFAKLAKETLIGPDDAQNNLGYVGLLTKYADQKGIQIKPGRDFIDKLLSCQFGDLKMSYPPDFTNLYIPHELFAQTVEMSLMEYINAPDDVKPELANVINYDQLQANKPFVPNDIDVARAVASIIALFLFFTPTLYYNLKS